MGSGTISTELPLSFSAGDHLRIRSSGLSLKRPHFLNGQIGLYEMDVLGFVLVPTSIMCLLSYLAVLLFRLPLLWSEGKLETTEMILTRMYSRARVQAQE